jgi:hypothetical protein
MFESKQRGDFDNDEEINDLVDDIADMIFLADGGDATDWNEYPIEIYRLFCYWRAAERDISDMRERRLDALVKGFLK